MQEKASENVKYAAISNATARALSEHVSTIHFKGNQDVNETAKAFAKALKKSEKVLFPISNKSRKTVQSALKPHQVVEVEVYNNSADSKAIQEAGAYIFTSPSNVESFFTQNKLPETAIVVAMGESTKETLEQYCSSLVRLPWAYNNLALWDAI